MKKNTRINNSSHPYIKQQVAKWLACFIINCTFSSSISVFSLSPSAPPSAAWECEDPVRTNLGSSCTVIILWNSVFTWNMEWEEKKILTCFERGFSDTLCSFWSLNMIGNSLEKAETVLAIVPLCLAYLDIHLFIVLKFCSAILKKIMLIEMWNINNSVDENN